MKNIEVTKILILCPHLTKDIIFIECIYFFKEWLLLNAWDFEVVWNAYLGWTLSLFNMYIVIAVLSICGLSYYYVEINETVIIGCIKLTYKIVKNFPQLSTITSFMICIKTW